MSDFLLIYAESCLSKPNRKALNGFSSLVAQLKIKIILNLVQTQLRGSFPYIHYTEFGTNTTSGQFFETLMLSIQNLTKGINMGFNLNK